MILVGGVGQLYLGDLDLGRHAAERLAEEPLGPDVVVEDLYYGALAVAQQLQDLRPATLILVGATERGRAPGSVEFRRVRPVDLDPDALQGAIHDAGTGYVSLDLVIEVAAALGALPERTVAVEVEPERTTYAEDLTPAAESGLEEALARVRREVARAGGHAAWIQGSSRATRSRSAT